MTGRGRSPTSRSSSSRPTRRSGSSRACAPSTSTRATRPRRRRRRQRVDRRHPRAGRARVSAGARVVDSREPRLRARQQPRRDDVRRALRAVPQPRHRDRRRHVRRARRGARRAARGRHGRRAAATGDGTLWPTIRYFPSVGARARRRARARALAAARPRWRGERELDMARYEQRGRVRLDLGLVHVRRREALLERRAAWTSASSSTPRSPTSACACKRAGWRSRHLPAMTIVHHAGKGGVRPRMVAQDAYTRRQYAEKHFAGPRRARVPRRGRRAPCGARDDSRRRDRPPAPRGGAPRAAHARRARGTALRSAAADRDHTLALPLSCGDASTSATPTLIERHDQHEPHHRPPAARRVPALRRRHARASGARGRGPDPHVRRTARPRGAPCRHARARARPTPTRH